ncbi:MAG TPA: ABC transporter substrate-binding protein [Candidatus Dormibacteraeota bacterium]|jgi:branched-chain amino acid transport system substrate-binding protein|nr:ABC transporter substrate-binding protein [Candidatus Dormibacteraeota bacterium]
MRARLRAAAATATVLLPLLLGGCGGSGDPIRIGAVFPLTGPQAATYSQDELAGVEIARDLVNADGGVAGRPIALDLKDLPGRDVGPERAHELKADGVPVVIGAYSSDLSMPVSYATSAEGMVYWEAGAVADQLTGRGLDRVFRVGATGSNLGDNSGHFAATQLAPMMGRPAADLRVSLVVADDDYAHSVADAATATARAAGMQVVSTGTYFPGKPDFAPVLAGLRAARPDILILASHIPDGVAFRRAMLASGIRVAAFIGSTMAQCLPDFGDALGADAVGVFASDRPGGGFDPATLRPEGRALYERLAAQWSRRRGGTPSEEGLSGFTAAWALFHDVLPRAAANGGIDPLHIAAAARAADLPDGTLPNGAGLRFSTDPARLGQNLRAAAVIWQWQAARHSVVVWPAVYATGRAELVPPRQ